MKFAVRIFVFVLVCCSIAFGQELTREQKFQKIIDPNNQNKELEQEFVLPDVRDLKQAEKEGFSAFRILPRETYDRNKLTIRGGGSYYSFTTKLHDYYKTPQIGLQQNNLKVGFAGADYGFIADLGEKSLADITQSTSEVNFLINYKPPKYEPEIRNEALKSARYDVDGFSFKSRIPAVVGHAYVLRAITFGINDVLVAFKVHRKDTDGSLIIFWKPLETFETPKMLYQTDAELTGKIEKILETNNFNDVEFEVKDNFVVLRGTVSKGQINRLVSLVYSEKPNGLQLKVREK